MPQQPTSEVLILKIHGNVLYKYTESN